MLGTSVLDNMERDIYIATTEFGGVAAGQVITWVTHASLVPEKRNVIAVFSKFNHTYKVLTQSKRFVLNLPSIDQVDLTCHFGLESGNDDNKFRKEIDFEVVDGQPILKNTTGYSILRVLNEVDLGDRIAVIARVESEEYYKEISPLKLRTFLKKNTPENIEIQKKNYLTMAERDSRYIRDEL